MIATLRPQLSPGEDGGRASIGEGLAEVERQRFFSALFVATQQKDGARRQIEGLVESLKEKRPLLEGELGDVSP